MLKINYREKELTILEDQITVGVKAPDVTLCREDFSEFKISDYLGKNILLTIFPSIDTSTCELQTREFNRQAALLDDLIIITVSVDLPPALGRFCASEGIDNLITASDYKYRSFAKEYGFMLDEFQFLARGNVFIDKEGYVRYVEYTKQLVDEPGYNAFLEFYKSL